MDDTKENASEWSLERVTQVRKMIRLGEWTRPTAELAAGFIQANLVIVPVELAHDFTEFCRLNPQPCPLIEALAPGVSEPSTRWAASADIRTDIPRYRIYEHGILTAEPIDIRAYFHDGLAAFLLGCSFSFDHVLGIAGIPVRHLECGSNVSMYETNIACRSAGVFAGFLVVSMRPIAVHLIDQVISITSDIPLAHGAPVHIGTPEAIGIDDLADPDYGEAVDIRADEVPVFWACGVTPQAIARQARLPLMITHAPGCMFITDRRVADLESK